MRNRIAPRKGLPVWARRTPLMALSAALMMRPTVAHAQDNAGHAEVVMDLLSLVSKATVADASSVETKRLSPAGGVFQRALFEHPKNEARPASVTLPLSLPSVRNGERLVFAFDVALSDGIPWDKASPTPDGVRFEALVDGKRVYSQAWRKSAWRPGSVDLTALAGRRVSLALRVHSLARMNYDWALWGRPRILRVTRSAPLSGSSTSVAIGVLTLEAEKLLPRRIRLIPDSSEPPLVWDRLETVPGDPSRKLSLEYQFPKARKVRVEILPAPGVGAPPTVGVAAFAPSLRVDTVVCVRALPLTGEPTTLQVTVRNLGPGMLRAGDAAATLRIGSVAQPARSLPFLAPGEIARSTWQYRPARAGRVSLRGAIVSAKGIASAGRTGQVETFLPPRPDTVLASKTLRLEFVRDAEQRLAGAVVRARHENRWVGVGSLYPLFRVLRQPSHAPLSGRAEERDWEPRPRQLQTRFDAARGTMTGELMAMEAPPEGGPRWHMSLQIRLDKAVPLSHLQYAYRPGKPTAVRALCGPNFYVGDGTSGEASSGGLFPGLEFLSGGEQSSSPRGFAPPLHERFTPHPDKITIPLMAVSIGGDSASAPLNPDRFYCPDSLKDMPPRVKAVSKPPLTVALLWNQQGGKGSVGKAPLPSARFVSPNREEGMANHRLGLFLPSLSSGGRVENADRAATPFFLPPTRPVTMEATLSVTVGPPLTAVQSWLARYGGLPVPQALPRSEAEMLALSRAAFLSTVWNPATRKWRGTIEGGDELLPGAATLLYLDSQTATLPDADAAQRSRARMEEGVQEMITSGGGPGVLTQRASSHILRWELPFLYGYLPEAMEALKTEIRQIQQGQRPDGGWRFRAGDAAHASLGAQGDGVSGVASHHAWMLLRYARITGDVQALAAGERALEWIARFRVPRGASVWECPIYEPDILAATWNVAACIEGYRATGKRRYLHDGVYWAETSVPFLYLWDRPDRPAMRGASIATFGTTFYLHSWLATPVQWEGLTLAYHLRHLADALEKAESAPASPHGSPFPLSLGFKPTDWRQLADTIFVSGLYQQVPDGERKGTYPDSITDFTKHNPFFINPENLMVYQFVRAGHDPDIRTLTIKTPDGKSLRISSVAAATAETREGGVRLRLRYFPGENIYLLLTGATPKSVFMNGEAVAVQAVPIKRLPGWSHEPGSETSYLCIANPATEAVVELQF